MKQLRRPPKYCQGMMDRHGKPRWYFRRPGYPRRALPGLPWSPQFMAEYAAAMEGDEVAKVIATNRALATRLQIQGTPSFIMGENFVRGFVELDQMRAIVDSIRQQRG